MLEVSLSDVRAAFVVDPVVRAASFSGLAVIALVVVSAILAGWPWWGVLVAGVLGGYVPVVFALFFLVDRRLERERVVR